MRSLIRKNHRLISALICTVGLLTCSPSEAWYAGGGNYHGGYHGGNYHGGYHGGYNGVYNNDYHGNGYYGNNGGAMVIINTPATGAYYPNCSLVQQCYPNGNCIQRQVCD
jgi:hypothetical protein